MPLPKPARSCDAVARVFLVLTLLAYSDLGEDAILGQAPLPAMNSVPAADETSNREEMVEILVAPGSRQRWRGEIIEYSGTGLVIRLSDGTEKHFPVDKVAAYRAHVVSAYEKAATSLSEGRVAEALRLFQEARAAESREWRRRETTSRIVHCLHALGEYARAGEEYVNGILARDPESPFRSCIPLAWFAEESLAPAETAAAGWIAASHPWARLLGASYLVQGTRGAAAVTVLEQLRLSPDKHLAFLASAQLWRRDVQTVIPEELLRREKSLNDLPGELKAGPYYVLGTAWWAQKEADRALLCLLRPAVLWPENRRIAARSLWEASQIVKKQQEMIAGANSNSVSERQFTNLLEELAQKFPETPWANQARQILSASSE